LACQTKEQERTVRLEAVTDQVKVYRATLPVLGASQHLGKPNAPGPSG
jgi:hypothetical protein